MLMDLAEISEVWIKNNGQDKIWKIKNTCKEIQKGTRACLGGPEAGFHMWVHWRLNEPVLWLNVTANELSLLNEPVCDEGGVMPRVPECHEGIVRTQR